MKIKCFFFFFVLSSATITFAQNKEKFEFLQILGGEPGDNFEFFIDEIKAFKKFSKHSGDFRSLLGVKGLEPAFYREKQSNNDLEKEFDKVIITSENREKECDRFMPLVLSTLGLDEDAKEIVPLSKKELKKLGYCEHVSAKTIKQSVDSILKKVKQQDHFLINFTGHGNYDEEGFTYSLGDNYFTENDFREIFSAIKNKNGHTQIFIDSCFGGNALRIMNDFFFDDDIWRGKLCGISQTDGRNMSLLNDENANFVFDKNNFNSTLQRFSCFLAQDSLNLPMTSLDYLIKNWDSKKNTVPTNINSCQKESSLFVLIESITTVNNHDVIFLRGQLIEQFKKSILESYNKCLPNDRFEKVKEDINPINNMVQCYKYIAETKNEYAPYKNLLLEIVGELEGRSKFMLDGTLTFADKKMIKHLYFLQNAGIKDLMKYKSLMCCLDYDFKNKKYPNFCY